MPLTKVRNQGLSFTSGVRNLIINGAMQVAQRGTSATSVTSGYNTCDRWAYAQSGSYAHTQTQETDAPDGYTKSLKVDVTTAVASPSSSNYAIVLYKIEAQDLQHLQYGKSSAEKVTLSFWVKSSKTGTYTIENNHNDANVYNPQTYTIDTAGS